MHILQIALGLAPVLAFLCALVVVDSYKLVRPRTVVQAIAAGVIASALCYAITTTVLSRTLIDARSYSQLMAPVLEETLKSLYVVYLLRRDKVGFLVDAAIFGFGIGAGFACLENLYYLYSLQHASLLLWFVRGFGTAIMHGATTAVLGIVAQSRLERRGAGLFVSILPAWGLAVLIHGAFNQFVLPPAVETLVMLVGLPMVLQQVFERSEASLKAWLGMGLDTDMSMLAMIRSGRFLESRVGKYLRSLKDRFPGEVLADMLCYIQLHLELAIRAKSLLMMREFGFEEYSHAEIQGKFAELRYLERSIGKTGRLVLLPLLRTSRRDLWQLGLLLGG